MLKGYVEVANLRQIIGWARDDAQPDMPVSLLITDNDHLVGRILANRYRADLDRAGIGHGRHSFDFHFSPGLTPFEKHVLRVRRETDGTDLARSPVTLEPSRAFDTAVQEALGDFIQSCGSDDEIVAKINFLVNHVEPLLKRLGDRDSYRFERDRYRQFLQRWRRMPMDASLAKRPEAVAPRALVIDDRIPRSDRDAGSLVILSHMQSLQRIGYEVAFTPADFGARRTKRYSIHTDRRKFVPWSILRLDRRGIKATSRRFRPHLPPSGVKRSEIWSTRPVHIIPEQGKSSASPICIICAMRDRPPLNKGRN